MKQGEKALRTALVTGGAGFIGSHLCEALVASGAYRVVSLDNYFTGKKENHVAGAEYIEGHTKNISSLVSFRPDIIFHLGEYSRVEKSFDDAELVWDMNIVGTHAVLEFAKKHDTKIVYAGSSTKFADEGNGRNESPYAWSKATNTEQVQNYGAWFGLPFATTYFYNVYGPREISTGPYATVIGAFKSLAAEGKPLPVVLPGTQKRNFTHVADIVRGIILVGEKGAGDGYALGTPASYSVKEVAEMFGGPIEMQPERRGNRMDSPLDCEKSMALGWKSEHSLEAYISEIKGSR